MTGSLIPIINKLESLFDIFNETFYDNSISKPVITVFPDTTSGCYGWATTWKAWKVIEGEEIKEGYYEINVCAEHLIRPFYEVCATLLHEMCHIYNLQNGIKDTSRGGTYHNKKFKEEAEKRGLLIDKDYKYGWTVTHLQPSTEKFIDTLGDNKFEMQRDKALKCLPKGGKSSSSSRKYVCPSCGMIVRATKEVNIICGDCNETMEVEE